MSTELPYDRKDKYAILKYAQLLTGKSLRMVIQDKLAPDVAIRLGKGGFGTMVEDLYFDYRPNSDAQADFPEAGIELKTTPLKIVQKGLVSKERLVFNIINYMEEHQQVFRTSSFWKKMRNCFCYSIYTIKKRLYWITNSRLLGYGVFQKQTLK